MRKIIAVALLLGLFSIAAQRRERVYNEESRRAGASALASRWDTYCKQATLADGRKINLTRTLRRIADEKTLHDVGLPRHDGDGTVFLNLTDRSVGRRPLPDKPRGYYIEYVHPPPKAVRWPGPERVIVGRGGEAYYSPEHYDPRSIVNLRDAR